MLRGVGILEEVGGLLAEFWLRRDDVLRLLRLLRLLLLLVGIGVFVEMLLY